MAKKKRKIIQPLVGDSRYEGKYVAFGASGKNIIASGKNPGTVIKKARNQGIETPAIVFVPKKGVTCVY